MNTQQQPRASVYAIILKLSPESTAQIARPGVRGAVAKAAGAGHAPTVRELVSLGQTEEFARLFSEPLGYLVGLQQAGVLRAAGPFEGLTEGMYLCNATNEAETPRAITDLPDKPSENCAWAPCANSPFFWIAETAKSAAHIRPSRADLEGRYGQSSRNVDAGCDGRQGVERAVSARTNDILRTTKSCGPGAPWLALSLLMMVSRRR